MVKIMINRKTVEIKRTFFLICTKCKKEAIYSYDEKSTTQRIMTYPRMGNCSKCGETIFNAKIEAKVK